jgi:3-phosphoshikimate 1-carboxyvinyltransferase
MKAASQTATDWWCRPAGAVHGRCAFPGTTITQRADPDALADGTSEIEGALDAEDCRSTARALIALGAASSGPASGCESRAGHCARPPRRSISETRHRPSSARGARGTAVQCDPDRRRVARAGGRCTVAEPLALMGTSVETTDGHAPVTITGAALHAIDYAARAERAGEVRHPHRRAPCTGTTCVHELAASRDHTERMLPALGCTPEVGAGVTACAGRCGCAPPAARAR